MQIEPLYRRPSRSWEPGFNNSYEQDFGIGINYAIVCAILGGCEMRKSKTGGYFSYMCTHILEAESPDFKSPVRDLGLCMEYAYTYVT